jgi:hypothetical protein
MPGDYFWHCVESLSIVLDGNHSLAESNLNLYEQHAMELPAAKREELRGQLNRIIGGLSQLHMRLEDRDNV